MANFVIPVEGGAINAHQQIEVQLGENLTTINLDYIHSTKQWAMQLSVDGEVIVAGAMLEPETDIIQAWHIWPTFGRMVIVGEDPTLDNLGIANSLVWIEPNAK